MTTLVILLLGLGAVLISSSLESNPDGSDVSVLQTISDIWNDKVNFSQATSNNAAATSNTSQALTTQQQMGVRSAEQNQQFATNMQGAA